MSPEACRGEEIGHAGDLYSLGVSWWFMLTGQYPFQAANLHGLLYKHISEALPPPTGLFDHVPEPVVKLVYQCLAKEATDRPESAQRLVEAIEALPAQGLLIPRDARELIGAGQSTPGVGGSTTAATLVSGNATAATVVSGGGAQNDATAATALAGAGKTIASDLSPQGAVAATVVANLGPQDGSAATANTIISPATAAAQAATLIQPAPAASGGGKGGLIAVMVVVVLALAGAGVWFATRGTPAPAPAQPVAAASTPAAVVISPKPVMSEPGTTLPTPASTDDPVKPGDQHATGASTAEPAETTTTAAVAPVVTPPANPPKPVEVPKPDPPKPVEVPKSDPPKPVEVPKPEPPKPVEVPKSDPPKPVEVPKPEPPKPIDTSAFDQALAAHSWKPAKSAADALPEPAQSDAHARLRKAASAQLIATMKTARKLFDDQRYAEAAKMLAGDMEAYPFADPDIAKLFVSLAKSVRQAAQDAQEHP
jgi:hypothetical protein